MNDISIITNNGVKGKGLTTLLKFHEKFTRLSFLNPRTVEKIARNKKKSLTGKMLFLADCQIIVS